MTFSDEYFRRCHLSFFLDSRMLAASVPCDQAASADNNNTSNTDQHLLRVRPEADQHEDRGGRGGGAGGVPLARGAGQVIGHDV